MSQKTYAVIGDPVAHSLSPQMHNSAFQALGINAKYVAIRVESKGLANFAETAGRDLAGFNITVPHKSGIIEFLDVISGQAKLCGSVNTVKIAEDGKLFGDSTDGYGLETAIVESFGIKIHDNSFMMIGAGGSSRAISFHLLSNGLAKLHIANRSLERVVALAHDLKKTFGENKVEVCTLDEKNKMARFIGNSSVIIQTSSLGLNDGDPSPLPCEYFLPDKFYYDTIYKRTAFLKNAEEKGCASAGGLSMLLHQGAKSFEIWTGLKAPVEVMRKALL